MKHLLSVLPPFLALLVLGGGLLQAQQPQPQEALRDVVAQSYFLGVQCEPAPDYVKKHVLNVDHGLLVRAVVPNSPAAKAGIQQGAILLQANGKPLATPAALRQVVRNSQGKEIKLLLWQQGKKQQLAIKPKKLDFGVGAEFPWFPGGFPGWAVPPEIQMFSGMWGSSGKIPEDVSIRIEKPAGKPAHVRVQRGKEVWEAPLNQLNKLPREPRRWVRRLLGRGVFPFPEMPPAGMMTPPFSPEQMMPPMPQGFQQRLQRLNQRLQQLQKRLEQLERRLAPPAKKQPQEKSAAD